MISWYMILWLLYNIISWFNIITYWVSYWHTTEIYCVSVTNLISVLIPEDYQVRHYFTRSDNLQISIYKSGFHLVQFNTVEISSKFHSHISNNLWKSSRKSSLRPYSYIRFYCLNLNVFSFPPQRFEQISKLPFC